MARFGFSLPLPFPCSARSLKLGLSAFVLTDPRSQREAAKPVGTAGKGKGSQGALKKINKFKIIIIKLLKTPRERDVLKSTTCSATLLGYFYIFMSVEQTTIYLPGFFGCKTISSGHGKQDGAGWLLQPQSGRVGGLGQGLLGQKVLYIPSFSPPWPSTVLAQAKTIIGEAKNNRRGKNNMRGKK